MKEFNKNILRILITILLITSLSACSSQSNPEDNQIVESTTDVSNDGITKTSLGKDYGLKEFNIYEMKSKQNNTYTFLRFKDAVVANRKENNYYSQSPTLADLSVTIIEGDDFKNNTMQQILDKATSYIQDITESQYQEKGNVAYKLVSYNMYKEKKDKLIVCIKTDTGYIIHDLSYFTNGTNKETKLVQAYIEDICTTFGFTIESKK